MGPAGETRPKGKARRGGVKKAWRPVTSTSALQRSGTHQSELTIGSS